MARIIRNAMERHAVGTALGRSAHEMAASQGRIGTIIDANADAIVIVDLDGIVRFANPAAALMFERSISDLVGNQFGFPVDSTSVTEVDAVRRDGSIVKAEMRVVEIRWDDASAWLLSLRDVSERTRAEAAIRASEEEFRLLSEAMPQIVWITRPDGWNFPALQILRCLRGPGCT